MKATRLMALGFALFLVATTTSGSSVAQDSAGEIILRVTSGAPDEVVTFEGSFVTPAQIPPFRYVKAATPYEVKLRETEVLCAMFSATDEGAKLSVHAVKRGPGEQGGTAWAAGRTVILNLEEERTSIRGF